MTFLFGQFLTYFTILGYGKLTQDFLAYRLIVKSALKYAKKAATFVRENKNRKYQYSTASNQNSMD